MLRPIANQATVTAFFTREMPFAGPILTFLPYCNLEIQLKESRVYGAGGTTHCSVLRSNYKTDTKYHAVLRAGILHAYGSTTPVSPWSIRAISPPWASQT